MLRVRPKSRKRGFTLVEVIVVLVIIAILAAIAIPALTGYIDKSKEFELVADTRVAVAAIQTWASYNYADGYRGNGGLVTQEGDPATFIAYDGDRPVASTGLYYEGDAGTPRLQGTDTTPKISPHTFYITYKFENEDGSFTMKDAPYSDNGGLFEYNVNVYEDEPIDFYITDFMLDGAQREITTLPQPPAIPAGYVPSREITEQVESGEPL
ncbi:MAG: prepilin-type N-terminal cleavage/methylation domain-containing protein, partial [Clostridiales Family XIII bacterium]|nr:prepilin-type N-terminal cleavage/methylation domain-containing protein [Clostridiales Family XIII bacterium]